MGDVVTNHALFSPLRDASTPIRGPFHPESGLPLSAPILIRESYEEEDYSLPSPIARTPVSTPLRISSPSVSTTDATESLELSETKYDWSEHILGKGELSVVYQATDRESGREVAIKRIPPSSLNPKRVQHLYKEAAILSRLPTLNKSHYFVHLIEGFIDHQGGICLVMDQVQGDELFELFAEHENGLDEEDARHYLRQIFEAVEELHAVGIAHLDLKLENIMYNKQTKEIKIIDFGFAEETINMSSTVSGSSRHRLQTNFCGSLDYSAPEILQHIPFDGKKADVWALGVMTFALLTGDFPFTGKRRDHLMMNIVKAKFSIPSRLSLSPNARSLLHRMLQRQPENRSSVNHLLQHPWFTPEAVGFGF